MTPRGIFGWCFKISIFVPHFESKNIQRIQMHPGADDGGGGGKTIAMILVTGVMEVPWEDQPFALKQVNCLGWCYCDPGT